MQSATRASDPRNAADMSDLLLDGLNVTHRAAMSGMESVNTWSDALRTRTDLSPTAIIKHTEIIGRLGHNAARLMTTVQRAAMTLDRLEHAAATRARTTARAGDRTQS